MHRVLILNLGDTSTKVSIFEDENVLIEENIHYDGDELVAANTQRTQTELRKKSVEKWMAEKDISLDSIDAVVIRTTLVYMLLKSGTYIINDEIRKYIYKAYKPDEYFMHAGWLTLPVIDQLLEGRNIPIYLVDPTSTDEFEEVARISGHPLVPRFSMFHALNHKAVARKAAKDLGKAYNEVNLVVAHMGGGVSVGAHKKGKVVDNTGGQGMEGPFCSNRAGTMPGNFIIDFAYSEKYSHDELTYMFLKKAGFLAYLGVGDMQEVLKMVEDGDEKAKLIYDAFIYQIGKAVSEMASVLCYDVDALVFTGGIAYSEKVIADIKARVGKIAPIMVYPGEKETEAMVAGALRVLRGEEEVIVYEPEA